MTNADGSAVDIAKLVTPNTISGATQQELILRQLKMVSSIVLSNGEPDRKGNAVMTQFEQVYLTFVTF